MSGVEEMAEQRERWKTEWMAEQRAKRWEARYDEAMDMALIWQQRYVEVRKELNQLLDELDKPKPTEGRHKASPPHPNTMIGRKTHGERDRDPAD